MIPFEFGKNNSGYITVGAIIVGYDFYSISEDSDTYNSLKNVVKTQKNDTKIILYPPSTYILQINTDQETKFYSLELYSELRNKVGKELNIKMNKELLQFEF